MRLVNAIEISPYDYGSNNRESPKGSVEKMPKEWNRFWLDNLSDSQLGHLTAVEEGLYWVDIETLDDSSLEVILKRELEKIDLSDYEDHTARLIGGLA